MQKPPSLRCRRNATLKIRTFSHSLPSSRVPLQTTQEVILAETDTHYNLHNNIHIKMPMTNGHTNGHSNGNTTYEMANGQSFLFTSESVGEGHPGEFSSLRLLRRPSRVWRSALIAQVVVQRRRHPESGRKFAQMDMAQVLNTSSSSVARGSMHSQLWMRSVAGVHFEELAANCE